MSETGTDCAGVTDSSAPGGVALYHYTQAKYLPAIVDQGLMPASSTHRDKLEAKLDDVAAEYGLEFPVTRQDCVFLYPSLDEALRTAEPDTEYDQSSIQSHSGIAVVDGTSVESPLYLGDFKLFSDAIDLLHMPEPDHAVSASSLTDALRQYAASFRRVESLSDIAEAAVEYRIPEVVVEGGVSSDAVREVMFWKSLHAGGLPRSVSRSRRPFGHRDQLSTYMNCCNFGPAAPDENIVYGACRPGYTLSLPAGSDVEVWMNHMEKHNIQRVCCLLDEKLCLYDGLLERYEERFGPQDVQSAHITDHDIVSPEMFHDRIRPFLNESVEREQRVVVHCLTGSGRTGHVLALWLAHERDYTLPAAIEAVVSAGDAIRNPLEAATLDDLASVL